MLRKYLSKQCQSVFTCGWIPIDMVYTTNDLFNETNTFMFKVDELILYLGHLQSDIAKKTLVASSFALSVVL